MNSIDERRLDILRHSLGLNRSESMYRNYYNTGKGSDDYDDCEFLVSEGYMTRRELSFVEGFVYTVTQKGKDLLGLR